VRYISVENIGRYILSGRTWEPLSETLDDGDGKAAQLRNRARLQCRDCEGANVELRMDDGRVRSVLDRIRDHHGGTEAEMPLSVLATAASRGLL